MARGAPEVTIERIETTAFRIPTDKPEADGTYAWDSTTLVTVHVAGGGTWGFGYTYGSAAIVRLIREQLAPRVVGRDALSVEAAWNVLVREVRNIGRPGIASGAISAIDAALWDLKAKLVGLPLVRLLGDVRQAAPVYGSGGFTSYDTAELCDQLVGWAETGMSRVKMKVGSHPDEDVGRVNAASAALAGRASLMVDANGAYQRAQAVGMAHAFAKSGVTWFEEPVSSDDREGLRFVREHEPPGMQVAAGEYGYEPTYFLHLLQANAIDVLQADATRCLGVTGFMMASRLCQAFGIPLSAHTAPSLHAHPACAATPLVHVEYFHDHVRIEQMLFEGFVPAANGMLEPDRARAGLGLELKTSDAQAYAI